MSDFCIKASFLILFYLQGFESFASEKYYWMSASQGRVTNIADGFSPFQLQVGRSSSGAITFKSKQINLSVKSPSNNATYPVNILFNPTILCNINGVPVSTVNITLELNNVSYSRSSNILIEDDQFRQYRLILNMLGVSSAERGSVLCDIRNALTILN